MDKKAEDLLAMTKRSPNRFAILVSSLTPKLIEWGGQYGKEITPAFAATWLEGFKEISPQRLLAAMQRVEKTFIPTSACPFPVPAHVWQVVSAASENESKVTTEAAWQKALYWSRREWHPDLLPGSRISPLPELPRKIHRALGAAGGPAHLFECSEEETQWSRKRFIEAYEQLDQLEEDEFFLSDGEAKSVLQNLLSPETAKQLVKGKSL